MRGYCGLSLSGSLFNCPALNKRECCNLRSLRRNVISWTGYLLSMVSL